MPTKKFNTREKFRGQKFFPFCMEVRLHGRHVREHLQYWNRVIGRVGNIANFQCVAHHQDNLVKMVLWVRMQELEQAEVIPLLVYCNKLNAKLIFALNGPY